MRDDFDLFAQLEFVAYPVLMVVPVMRANLGSQSIWKPQGIFGLPFACRFVPCKKGVIGSALYTAEPVEKPYPVPIVMIAVILQPSHKRRRQWRLRATKQPGIVWIESVQLELDLFRTDFWAFIGFALREIEHPIQIQGQCSKWLDTGKFSCVNNQVVGLDGMFDLSECFKIQLVKRFGCHRSRSDTGHGHWLGLSF